MEYPICLFRYIEYWIRVFHSFSFSKDTNNELVTFTIGSSNMTLQYFYF